MKSASNDLFNSFESQVKRSGYTSGCRRPCWFVTGSTGYSKMQTSLSLIKAPNVLGRACSIWDVHVNLLLNLKPRYLIGFLQSTGWLFTFNTNLVRPKNNIIHLYNFLTIMKKLITLKYKVWIGLNNYYFPKEDYLLLL